MIGIKTGNESYGGEKSRKYPGVGAYNVDESARYSSKLQTAPRCSFGTSKRLGIPTKPGPGPNMYTPSKLEKVQAPRPFIPSEARLGSAPLNRIKKGKSMSSL